MHLYIITDFEVFSRLLWLATAAAVAASYVKKLWKKLRAQIKRRRVNKFFTRMWLNFLDENKNTATRVFLRSENCFSILWLNGIIYDRNFVPAVCHNIGINSLNIVE